MALSNNLSGFPDQKRCTLSAAATILPLHFPSRRSWASPPSAQPAGLAPDDNQAEGAALSRFKALDNQPTEIL